MTVPEFVNDTPGKENDPAVIVRVPLLVKLKPWKLPPPNSMTSPAALVFHDPESIWLLGTRLRPLPPLRVSVLVATPLPPLTSTVPPLNRPACQKACPDTVMVRLPELGKPFTLSQTTYCVPKPLGLTTKPPPPLRLKLPKF